MTKLMQTVFKVFNTGSLQILKLSLAIAIKHYNHYRYYKYFISFTQNIKFGFNFNIYKLGLYAFSAGFILLYILHM